VYNVIIAFIILKAISFITPLRMDEATLKVGDDAVHGETAYAIGTEGEQKAGILTGSPDDRRPAQYVRGPGGRPGLRARPLPGQARSAP
jgi:hypothetical protein